MKRRYGRLLLALLVALTIIFVSGCGGGKETASSSSFSSSNWIIRPSPLRVINFYILTNFL